MSKHKRGNRVDRVIQCAWYINVTLASAFIFIVWSEIWRAVA